MENNNFDTLQNNLPDYIKNNLSDSKLKKQIADEIENNKDFRKVYINMSKTMNLMADIKLNEPPENYFNNFLPNIRAKIEKRRKKVEIFSFSYLFSLRKYLAPVLPVILIILILKLSGNNPENSIEQIYNISVPEKNDSLFKQNNSNEFKTEIDNTEKSDEQTKPVTKQNNQNSNIKNEVSDKDIKTEILNIQIDDEESMNLEDEMNIENDFEELDEDSQNSIINTIKNENF